MKEKRHYEKLSMKVFELKHRSQLLVGSNPQSQAQSQSLQNYDWNTYEEE